MYLPTFYKTKNELQVFRGFRYSKIAPAAGLWLVWAMWPSLYNLIYTDIFPPAKGLFFIYRCVKKNN